MAEPQAEMASTPTTQLQAPTAMEGAAPGVTPGSTAGVPPAISPKEPPSKKRRVVDLLVGGMYGPVDVVVPDETATSLSADGSWAAAQAITKQMPSVGIPMAILTGFLGAGKSTVLNYILKHDHGLRIAVLINEFGAVDIDNQLVDSTDTGAEGDPIQLNNGCVCCTISNGFIDAVRKILDRPGKPPHYFILETSGVADPKPIIDSVANTELRGELYVDQVLTVIDASSWTPEHYDSETAQKQLIHADTVLLSKTDLAKEDRVKEVIEDILDVKPNTRVLKSQKGYVPIAALFDIQMTKRTVDEKKQKEEAEKKKHEHGHEHEHGHPHKHADDHKHGHNHGHDHDHKHHDHKHGVDEHGRSHGDAHHGHNHAPGEECGTSSKKKNHLEEEGFSSISFTSDKTFSLYRFKNEFMEIMPDMNIFRAKGLLWFKNYNSRFIFHWSGSRFNVEEDEWPEGVTPSNQLVVIGRKLDKDKIMEMLGDCVTRPDDPEDEDEYGYGYGDEEEEEEDIYAMGPGVADGQVNGSGVMQNGQQVNLYGTPGGVYPAQPVGMNAYPTQPVGMYGMQPQQGVQPQYAMQQQQQGVQPQYSMQGVQPQYAMQAQYGNGYAVPAGLPGGVPGAGMQQPAVVSEAYGAQSMGVGGVAPKLAPLQAAGAPAGEIPGYSTLNPAGMPVNGVNGSAPSANAVAAATGVQPPLSGDSSNKMMEQ